MLPEICAGLKDKKKNTCQKMAKKCKEDPNAKKCKLEKFKKKCNLKKTMKQCEETCCHILAFPSSPP